MKKALMWAALFIALAVLAGCGTKQSGRYVNQDNLGEYVELKPDGNFVLKLTSRELSGAYEIKDGSLTLYVPLVSGETELKAKFPYFQGLIKGNTIKGGTLSPDGWRKETWVKK